jgi:hypothetical protein
MESQTLSAAFAALTSEQQMRFLLNLGHNLTIAARTNYAFQSPEVVNPKALRAINEIQHRLFNHLRALHSRGSFRYPDAMFVTGILDHEDVDLRKACEWAFSDALKKTAAVPADPEDSVT